MKQSDGIDNSTPRFDEFMRVIHSEKILRDLQLSSQVGSMPPLRNADDIIRRAQEVASEQGIPSVAVPAAGDDDVIGAIKGATDAGFVRAILIGDEQKINHFCDELKVNREKVTIIAAADDGAAAKIACTMAANKEASLIMKGNMPTGKLLKTVLAKEYGFRTGRILSHVAVLSIPNFPRLLGITDGGMVVAPTEQTRAQLVENAVEVFHALEIPEPKVALLSAVDNIRLDLPATRDLAAFAKAAERGLIKGAIVDGPLAFDSAVLPAAIDKVGFRSPVVGAADVLVVGGFEAGNIIVKSLDILAEAVFAGVIVGTKLPVALVSRSDTARNKLTSVALATLVAAKSRSAS